MKTKLMKSIEKEMVEMSKTIWKKVLGGSLKIYQQERSQYMQMTFYVSPNYYVNDKHKKNGMFVDV